MPIAEGNNPNLEILETTVDLLGPLAADMVFVGGCATGLLISDPGAPPIRATQDVDVIVEVASLHEYHRLSASLRERGFKEDSGRDAPICRWRGPGVILDAMPTRREILGFGNDWYRAAAEAAVNVALPSGSSIRMVTAPYFLVTKLAAFDGRGKGDYLMSHDMEDVVAVLDGRPQVVDEVRQADKALREELARRFAELLADAKFEAALPGHLPGDALNQTRVPLVRERIEQIAASA